MSGMTLIELMISLVIGLVVLGAVAMIFLSSQQAYRTTDGLGKVHRFAPVGESFELIVDAPHELGKFLAYKGSVVVNGVSLTVNRVEDLDAVAGKVCRFSINLIPHTIEVTTLKHLAAGSRVNLEIDLIARYVERMLSAAR